MKTRMPRSPFPTRHRPAASSPTSPGLSSGRLLVSPTDPARGPDRRSGRGVDRIAAGLEKINACTLCGASPATRKGVWCPTAEASRKLGAAEGKMRLIVWGVCEACGALPDVMQRVENQIFEEAAAGLSQPEAN